MTGVVEEDGTANRITLGKEFLNGRGITQPTVLPFGASGGNGHQVAHADGTARAKKHTKSGRKALPTVVFPTNEPVILKTFVEGDFSANTLPFGVGRLERFRTVIEFDQEFEKLSGGRLQRHLKIRLEHLVTERKGQLILGARVHEPNTTLVPRDDGVNDDVGQGPGMILSGNGNLGEVTRRGLLEVIILLEQVEPVARKLVVVEGATGGRRIPEAANPTSPRVLLQISAKEVEVRVGFIESDAFLQKLRRGSRAALESLQQLPDARCAEYRLACHEALSVPWVTSSFQMGTMRKSEYIDVDRLQAETTLQEAARKCGVQIEPKGSGKEVRIDCPFGCPGDHAGRREISVNTEHPQKVFYCHGYDCGVRGNLLALMHGWLHGRLPTGGRLKGKEFNDVKRVLAGETPPASKSAPAPSTVDSEGPSAMDADRNLPLAASENEAARQLLDIDEKFRIDPAEMNPKASRYVRARPYLSSEVMQKWRMGYLPNDGGGDKRGWSLRGHMVYAFLSNDNQLLGWIGRDPAFEEKEAEFLSMPPEQRGTRKPPVKYRFPKGFHRGLELFGQQGRRLKEPGYREAISAHGILVVEGLNDVIALDAMGVPTVGLCSNRVTEQQVAKIAYWSRRLCGGRVTLMFDCQPAGDEGSREALWLLAQQGLDVRLAWSQAMHGGKFAGREPESLAREAWESIIGPAIER